MEEKYLQTMEGLSRVIVVGSVIYSVDFHVVPTALGCIEGSFPIV